jgi:hypothetical protein
MCYVRRNSGLIGTLMSRIFSGRSQERRRF